MSKTLSTLFVALFAVVFAGAAMAAPADQPVPDAQPAADQAVEAQPDADHAVEAQAAPAVAAPATDALMTPLPAQGPPNLEECGDVFCPPNFFCCNPLENLCVREGQACIL